MKYIQKNSSYVNKWLLLYKDNKKSYDIDIRNKRSRGKNNYDKILDNLLDEQGYICAYCMRKISSKNSTIEHFIGQSYIDENGKEIGKREDTNYQNMLAVCNGIYCKNELHCDSKRADYQKKYKNEKAEKNNQILSSYRPLLFISPLNKQQMSEIGFTRKGKIYYKKNIDIDLLEENIDKLEKEIKEEKNKKSKNKKEKLLQDYKDSLIVYKNVDTDMNDVLNLNCENIREERKKIITIIHSSLQKYNYSKSFAQKELVLWEEKQNNYRAYCQVAISELRKYI